jgi:hypothetical protein
LGSRAALLIILAGLNARAQTRGIPVPARGEIDYTYVVLPLGFEEDRWVVAAEAKPAARAQVHHLVAYIREPESEWLRDVPPRTAWTPAGRTRIEKRRIGFTRSDVLLVYTPGTGPMRLPAGMAKRIRAGSDLVLQIHYSPNGTAAIDRPKVALTFARERPEHQVLTLQLNRDDIRIPPGERDYRLTVTGTLPNDALLLGMMPHLHTRGRSAEYRIVGPDGRYETLLRVPAYDFYWQIDYRLAKPRPLPAGTRLQFEARWDNSPNNPRNPDPAAEVEWGEQSWQEMMTGFFDVAVPATMDKERFFVRPR